MPQFPLSAMGYARGGQGMAYFQETGPRAYAFCTLFADASCQVEFTRLDERGFEEAQEKIKYGAYQVCLEVFGRLEDLEDFLKFIHWNSILRR